jgi:hypothetical protein
MGEITVERTIENCVRSYLKDEGIFTTIGVSKSVRGVLEWGYNIESKRGTIQPIEQAENKLELWQEALKWELPKEERIKLAKGLHYLQSVAHRYLNS